MSDEDEQDWTTLLFVSKLAAMPDPQRQLFLKGILKVARRYKKEVLIPRALELKNCGWKQEKDGRWLRKLDGLRTDFKSAICLEQFRGGVGKKK